VTTVAVDAAGLVCRAGGVDGLDLYVPAGLVHALVGPDRSARTTTLRILAALVPPDAGTARVLGHDVVTDADEVRARVRLPGSGGTLDEGLTAPENLLRLARLLGHSPAAACRRTDQLLTAFGLCAATAVPVRHWLPGPRKRFDIAAAIVVRPDLLLLDEPTTGLDPHSRAQVEEVVRALARSGTTVLLTTGHPDEAEVTDRVSVLAGGRVVAEGTPADLLA
jgi:ABC-2 type transport system ATP-binding protein